MTSASDSLIMIERRRSRTRRQDDRFNDTSFCGLLFFLVYGFLVGFVVGVIFF